MADRKSSQKKTLAPREARTFKKICTLTRDNLSAPNAWIMVEEETVIIAEQQRGSPAKGIVRLSRATFERFVHWYNTGETRKPKGKRRSASSPSEPK